MSGVQITLIVTLFFIGLAALVDGYNKDCFINKLKLRGMGTDTESIASFGYLVQLDGVDWLVPDRSGVDLLISVSSAIRSRELDPESFQALMSAGVRLPQTRRADLSHRFREEGKEVLLVSQVD